MPAGGLGAPSLVIEARVQDFATAALDKLKQAVNGVKANLLGAGRIFALPFKIMESAIKAPFKLVGSLFRLLTDLRTWLAGYFVRTVIGTFADFEFALYKVRALLAGQKIDFDQFRINMERVAIESGQSLERVAKSARLAISSQVVAYEDLASFLTVTGRLALVAGDEMFEVTRGVVQVISSYGYETANATDIAEIFFKAMEQGHAEITELASTLGRVNAVAQSVGISFKETAAGVAALTRLGVRANEAATAYRQLISSIARTTKGAESEFEKFGLTLHQLQSGGFIPWLDRLAKELGSGNAQAGKLFRNIRAYFGALGLAMNNAEDIHKILERMNDELGPGFHEAAKLMAQSAKYQLGRAKQAINSVFVELGAAIKPEIVAISNTIEELAVTAIAYMPVVRVALDSLYNIFQEIGTAISESFDQGTLWDDILVFLEFLGKNMLGFFRFLGRQLVIVMEFLGKQLGRGFVRAFITTSKADLALYLSDLISDIDKHSTLAGGVLASLKSDIMGVVVGLTGMDTQKLADVGYNLRQMKDAANKAGERVQIFQRDIRKLGALLAKDPDDPRAEEWSRMFMQAQEGLRIATKDLRHFRDQYQAFASELGTDNIPQELDKGLKELRNKTNKNLDAWIGEMRIYATEFWGGLSEPAQEAGINIEAIFVSMLDQMRELAPQVAEEIDALKKKIKEGIKGGAADDITAQLTYMEEQLVTVFGGMGDAVGDFFFTLADKTKDAGDAFKAMGDTMMNVLQSVAKELIKKGVLMLLLAVFGGGPTGGVAGTGGSTAGGGLLGFLGGSAYPELQGRAMGDPLVRGGVGRYANGNPMVSEPELAWLGEGRMNEAIVPLPDGRRIPVEMRGGGAGQTVVVNNHISAMDSQDVGRALVKEGKLLSKIVLDQAQKSGAFARKLGTRVTKGVRS